MTIETGMLMIRTGEFPRHSCVRLPFLLIVDRYIERRVFQHYIDVRNIFKHALSLVRVPFACYLYQSHVLLYL